MLARTLLLLALPVGAVLAGCSKTPDTNEFLTKAIKGDDSEVRLGALAKAKGGAAVRDFGTMLVADHTKARAEAVAVARRHGVTPPTGLLAPAAEEERTLGGLHGASFDREFAQYMAKDHGEDVTDFRKMAESNAPADVRALARNTLPTLEKHLAMAKRLGS